MSMRLDHMPTAAQWREAVALQRLAATAAARYGQPANRRGQSANVTPSGGYPGLGLGPILKVWMGIGSIRRRKGDLL